jgi:selenocysteine lyase/cysteine desulfurase
MKRRDFLEGISGAVTGTALFGSAALESVQAAEKRTAHLSPQEAARDESLWREVQNAFSINRSIVNLDNGNVCPSPRNVTEALVRYIWELQDAPGYMLWDVLEPLLLTARNGLAKMFGCEVDEIALVRNATEALDAVLLGVEMRPGDEILMTMHDYWAMHDAVDQRARREGVAVKKISNVPMPPKSMSELVEMYERNITPKTRLILLTHPVNYTGQLFPVKEICEMAHRKGIEVVVDGAQSFAHVDYKQADLGCDYFGTSLHKWLGAPIGTGMLYIRKDKIGKVYPLVPASKPKDKNYKEKITKFQDFGTHSVAMALAVSEALAFHNGIGSKRKEERLRHLTSYWSSRIEKLPNVRFFTSFAPEMSCGLATFEIVGIEPNELSRYLGLNHMIATQPMSSPSRAPEIRGVRVTPNVYTTLDELDYFCAVIEKVAKQGIPKST